MSASESRSDLVLELAEEFLARYRQGERPSLKEYLDRHPELAAEIKEVFPAMALMENIALADDSLGGDATGPTQTATSAPPAQMGDYRILREVGRGGMGIVYEAEQVSLGRHVALKVLPRQMFVDEQQRRRFEREAKAAAKLHHTNIVPVFGVGEHEGMPYYVMQFIQGLGLDDVLHELKRMNGGSPSATGGELRVGRKDVSATDAARSLLSGAFVDSEREPDAPRSPENGSDKLSDSFTLSSSSVTLPGTGGVAHSKGKKATYWQSVARIGAQIADALDYAHKQGIRHRDIKPSNLLLDTRGTVWVTDFGLARADSEDHLTQTGDIVGTLRYMPPEAFEGRADQRGDIYSLGLTLYELLALKPAFEERDRRRLIKLVTTEEPARLDKLSRAIPRDLVTIVHKAIDREPSRRYATAAELEADLQRFLDDEPIQARPITSAERFARWCRHYPGVATLTAALAVILVTVTVVSLVAAARFDGLAREQAAAAENERQARREAEQAKEHEAALRKQAEEAKQQAESNLREAERQKQRADTNFAKARKAVDDYFTTVSDSQLLRVAGMQPLRRDLLQSALGFYQDFLKERGNDPALRGDLAAALLRVAKIRRELGEAAAARKTWEQARDLYETLAREAPESAEWRHGLAQSYYWLGRFEDAIVLLEKLVQPDQPRFQKELADAYNLRASRYQTKGEIDKALQVRQQILAIREMLHRLNPDDADAQRDLGGALSNLGGLLYQNGRFAEALPLFRRAAENAEAAFARAPQGIDNGTFLALCQLYISYLERHFGHEKEALAALRRGVEVSRKLARDNPAVPQAQSYLFRAYSSLALYQRELKQTEQAERNMRLAREVGERLPSDNPADLYNLACYRALNAASYLQGKDKPTAEEQAEQKREADLAMDAFRKALAAGWRDLEWIRKDSDLNVLRGRADFKSLEAELAARLAVAPPDKLAASQHVLDLRQKRAEIDPKNNRLRADLAASEHAIALIQLDLGKTEEAQKHLQQAITLRAALVQDEPKNAQYQADLAASRFALGDFHWQLGRLAEAVKTWRRELDVLEAAARQASDRSSLTRQLVAMQRSVGQHYARAGLFSEAAAHYDRLITLEGATETDHYDAACLALRSGDAAAYRRNCEAMTKRFGDTVEVGHGRHLVWAGALADSSGVDTSRLLQRAKHMTETNAANERWWHLVLALSHYRAGRFAEAIAHANQSTAPNPRWLGQLENWPLLAMAHHRLGHAAEARKWLDQSTAEWRRLSPLPRSPGSLTVLPSSPESWSKFWHDWLTFEILLREASVLIAGVPPVEEAYHHAHRSLLYRQLGENEKAETEWQAALKIAPREPAWWLARARLFAQMGQHDKADADFAKAAALTPEELDRFPQAGWWVVGPYPADLKSPCPPEKDPDPSRPVAAVVAADETAKELHWRPVPTDPDGRVHLWDIFRANQISAYALTYVYSPQERTAALLVDGKDRVRVWLNGRLVHETDHVANDFEQCDRVPVTLKAGRNTLLCRVSQTTGRASHHLHLRIGDNPLDRAGLYATLGLWDEAAAQFDRGIERLPSAHDLHYINHYVRCAAAHLVLGDTAGYRRCLALLFEDHDRDSFHGAWLAYAGGLRDDAVKASQLVELAESALERNRNAFVYHAAGLAHYRASAFEKAIARFEDSLKQPSWPSSGGRASELGLALAHHRLGHVKEAQQWLDRAEQWYDKAIQEALASPSGRATLIWWPDWPSFVVLRREAHKVIRGADVPDDPRLKKLADRTRDWLQKRDPATLDYDVAIYCFPWQPRLRLARGRRLAELKRHQEAQADLDLAVQRKADDPETWKERGRLYFQKGQPDKAAADFGKAVELLGDKALSSEPAASEADKLFAKVADDAFLKKLTTAVESNPDDMDRRRERGDWYARHRRWKEAAADFKLALERDPPVKDLQWLHAAPALAAAGDHEGYRWICRELRKRFGDSQDPFICDRLAKVHLLLPDADKDTEWAGQLADRAATVGKNKVWAPYLIVVKGLADYRRGSYRGAAEELEALLHRVASRQDVEEASLRILSRPDLSANCHLILAMSYHKQEQTKAAREHFERATQLLDQYVSTPALFPIETKPQYSHDWLIAWLLHREAQTLIEGKKVEPEK